MLHGRTPVVHIYRDEPKLPADAQHIPGRAYRTCETNGFVLADCRLGRVPRAPCAGSGSATNLGCPRQGRRHAPDGFLAFDRARLREERGRIWQWAVCRFLEPGPSVLHMRNGQLGRSAWGKDMPSSRFRLRFSACSGKCPCCRWFRAPWSLRSTFLLPSLGCELGRASRDPSGYCMAATPASQEAAFLPSAAACKPSRKACGKRASDTDECEQSAPSTGIGAHGVNGNGPVWLRVPHMHRRRVH